MTGGTKLMDTVRVLKAVQTGDQSAFDSLLNEGALRLHAIAFHITGDSLLAEETIRKAFLLIREGQSPQEEENVRAWITHLAARTAVEAVRERGELPPGAKARAPVVHETEGAPAQGSLPP